MQNISRINSSIETAMPGQSAVWLFSARIDLIVFLGSAIVSLLLLPLGASLGVLHHDTPDWMWIPAVMLIDVAHVYSTGFRVYLDTDEFKRRPALYALVPALGLLLGIALYSEGALTFWRALAYLAVFHFVRQQYGWVALYRAKAGETDRLGKWIDSLAIYAATVYPLLYWHAHLPRTFWWFLDKDFFAASWLLNSLWFDRVTVALYVLILTTYFARSLWHALFKKEFNPGKDIIVATTAACWYLGIVACNSDYAFTVTNVIIHGVPYLALIYWQARGRIAQQPSRKLLSRLAFNPATFLLILWALAFVEEMFWDKTTWHERSWLFGEAWNVEAWKFVIVPLLALPQITHYVLDGFIWRRRSNPDFPWGSSHYKNWDADKR